MTNQKVDHYLQEGCGRCPLGGTPDCKVHNWTEELKLLREIVLDCGLTEELKWGVPCYTFNQKNIVLVSALKGFCTVSFFKGVLLADPDGLLEKPGENSQSDRYMKFTGIKEVQEKEKSLRSYLFEAIEIEKAGLRVEFKKTPEPMPKELEERLKEDAVLKNAFEALTPGRQRGYIIYFSQPKQSSTRMNRIEKWTPKILNGEGMHDKYQSMKK